jgi:hypothetical protein
MKNYLALFLLFCTSCSTMNEQEKTSDIKPEVVQETSTDVELMELQLMILEFQDAGRVWRFATDEELNKPVTDIDKININIMTED